MKKIPSSEEDIPDFLYAIGTKSNEVARLIVFEGMTDAEAIARRTGLTTKTVGTVKRAIFKAAEEIRGAQKPKRGAGGSEAKGVEPEVRDVKPGQVGKTEIHTLHKDKTAPPTAPGAGSPAPRSRLQDPLRPLSVLGVQLLPKGEIVIGSLF